MPERLLKDRAQQVTATVIKSRLSLDNLVCLVIDCTDPCRKFKVVPIADPTVKELVKINLHSDTWAFIMDSEAKVQEFWSDHRSFSSANFAFVFKDTEYDPYNQMRVGYNIENQGIPIGQGLTDRTVRLLVEDFIDQPGSIYSAVGVYDRTNLEHLANLANDAVIESE